ncbi:MAG: hypothetical protein GXP25_04645 [Planctomycetes bacterium]|nr:hypothetical protein [Planctomycetota bacterium]
MRKNLTAALVALALLACPVLCQERDFIQGKDDMEAFATLFRIAVLPFDLFGTPAISIWGEAWTLPARGADLLEYQDKYYYDYGTLKWREGHDPRRTGGAPFTEFKAPGHRARKTPSILYLPPAKL